MLADVACVALNRLPARYVRHDVDLVFYLTEHERNAIELSMAAAMDFAFIYVTERAAKAARKSHQALPQTSWRFRSPGQLGALGFHRDVIAMYRAGKPHCGDKHSWSSGTYFAASSMRRLRSLLDSMAPNFVVTRPSTTILPLGRKRSGRKSPLRSSSYSRK